MVTKRKDLKNIKLQTLSEERGGSNNYLLYLNPISDVLYDF